MTRNEDSSICLLNPPTTDPGEAGIYFPMALLTLGGVLKKIGVKAELWDLDLYFKKTGNQTERHFRRFLQKAIDTTPSGVFGISSICSNLPITLWIAKEIKAYRPESLIILGGAQPSSLPFPLLEKFDFIDVVVPREGEVTLG